MNKIIEIDKNKINKINENKINENKINDNKINENKIKNNQINDNNIIKNDLIKLLPLRQLLENRDRSLLYDPIVPPERRINIDQYPVRIQDLINIPSRGYPDNYQLMGIASRDNDEKIVQLFGRATFPGSNQFEYYVTTSEFGFANKIPVTTRGQKEILDNDIIHIPELNKGNFKVKIYNYNTPRYNPYI
jgi:hypothetical protein